MDRGIVSEGPKTRAKKLAYILQYDKEHREQALERQLRYQARHKDKMDEYNRKRCELRKAFTMIRHIDVSIFS